MNQAADYLQQYQAAYQNRQLLTPSQSFLPKGKLGTALGTNQVEQVEAQRADAAVQDLQQRTQLAYNGAVASYERVTKLTPNDSNAWFSLAQAAQQAGELHDRRHRVQALPQAQPRVDEPRARSRR